MFLLHCFQFLTTSLSSNSTSDRRVEAEQNPDLVTRAQLQVARTRNDETRGRLLATQALRDHMLAGLSALDDVPDLPSANAASATIAASESSVTITATTTTTESAALTSEMHC